MTTMSASIYGEGEGGEVGGVRMPIKEDHNSFPLGTVTWRDLAS